MCVLGQREVLALQRCDRPPCLRKSSEELIVIKVFVLRRDPKQYFHCHKVSDPMIPNNDPVRLLNACVEGMDLSELYQTYTRVPKNLATPKQLFKIVAYAAMNGTFSSRKQAQRERVQNSESRPVFGA